MTLFDTDPNAVEFGVQSVFDSDAVIRSGEFSNRPPLKMVCVPDCEPEVATFVPAMALANVVATLNVSASILIT